MSHPDTPYPFKTLGVGVVIYPLAKIVGAEHMEIGSHVIIDDFVFVVAAKRTIIGNYVHIASFTSITGGGECVLEDFSTLSSGVRVLTGTDDFLGGGLTNSTIPPAYRAVTRSRVVVKKHAIVGAGTVIFPGVVVGEGAAVSAGSIVTKDLEPWTVYAGGPARAVKRRPSERILELEQRLYQEAGRPEKSYQGF